MTQEKVHAGPIGPHLWSAPAPRAVVMIREPFVLLLLAWFVVLLYAGTLQYPFLFDDIPNILENEHIRLNRIDLPGLVRAGFCSPQKFRPVANISFALNYRMHGYDVAGYHLVNIMIHVITGLLFYALAKTTLALAGGGGRPLPPIDPERFAASNDWHPTALCAAALWMVHPIQTQSVTYLVQRMNSLCSLFFLLALLFYVRARLAPDRWRQVAGYAACACAGLLALGSKEIGATLPFFIFLYEWYFFRESSLRWLWRQKIWIGTLTAAGLCFLFFYMGPDPGQRILSWYRFRDFTPSQRLMTEFGVVIFYLSLLAFPHPSRLNLDHDFPISRSFYEPVTTPVTIGAIIALLILAMVFAKRYRLFSFAVLWYLGNLVIESSVIGLEIIFEHRTYLPSMFLFLQVAVWLKRLPLTGRIKTLLVAGLIIVLGLWTFERNQVWQNYMTLWTDCAEKSPRKARPNNKRGVALARRGRLNAAMDRYRRAMAADPKFANAYFNMGNVLRRLGRVPEAVDYYEKALYLIPGDAKTNLNLGVALVRLGQYKAAAERFSLVLEKNPNDVLARKNLGLTLLHLQQFEAAVAQFEAALGVDPDNAELLYSLGNALADLGYIDRAIAQYRLAIARATDSGPIYNNLGMALMAKGSHGKASVYFRAALRLRPKDFAIRRNLQIAMGMSERR